MILRHGSCMIPAIWDRATNNRWTGKFDARYRRLPLHRVFGGYKPGIVRAKDLTAFIGNRNRLERRA